MASHSESEFLCQECGRITFVITKGAIGFHATPGTGTLKIIPDGATHLPIRIVNVEWRVGAVVCPECGSETPSTCDFSTRSRSWPLELLIRRTALDPRMPDAQVWSPTNSRSQ